MKEELEKQLEHVFPFMKRNKAEDERNIYKRWGCECSDGWFQLIYDLCQAITDRYAEDGMSVDIVVNQIKQKFAALRFYYSYEDASCGIAALDFLGDGSSIRFKPPENESDDDSKKKLRHDIAMIVHTYEAKSKSICEVCGDGNTAKTRIDMRWKQTLCDTCYANYVEKLEEKKKI